MFRWLSNLLGISVTTAQPTPKQTPTTHSHMNEGDIHSGPYGYSPNTPYQETQYGSRFDEEADWNEDEH
jgi:hypothetical protein